MAKAAWCAACGANVYLSDDGLCPQGHGPENLSNHYEAPDLSPADQAHYDAAAPAEKRKTNKTLIIVLAIVGLLVLCGIGACVAGIIGFSTIADTASEAITDSTTELTSAQDGTGGETAVEFDTDTELRGLTEHFFPGFQPTTYYLVGDGATDPLEYQIVAVAGAVPEFSLAFTAYRYADSSVGSDDDPAWFWGTDSNAVWERSDTSEGDGGATLSDFAGADPMLGDEQRAQIMTDLTAAHPGKVVTDFMLDSNVDIGLAGIDEAELDDWDGMYTTFESKWHIDLASGSWSETGFTEN